MLSDTLGRRTGVGFGGGSAQGYSWELDGDLTTINHTYPGRTSDNAVFGYDHDRIGRAATETISHAAYDYGKQGHTLFCARADPARLVAIPLDDLALGLRGGKKVCVPVCVAQNMGGNPDYELTPGFLSDGGCNSNCWGAAVVEDSEAIAREQGSNFLGDRSARRTQPGGMDLPGENYGDRVERTNPSCVPGDTSGC